MLRKTKLPFASLAVSSYAHSILGAWLQISNHFLLSIIKQEKCQKLGVLLGHSRPAVLNLWDRMPPAPAPRVTNKIPCMSL